MTVESSEKSKQPDNSGQVENSEQVDLEALRQKYLKLTKDQANSEEWTQEKFARMKHLESILMPNKEIGLKHKQALLRQAVAGTVTEEGGEPHPPLNEEEQALIAEASKLIKGPAASRTRRR